MQEIFDRIPCWKLIVSNGIPIIIPMRWPYEFQTHLKLILMYEKPIQYFKHFFRS